MTGMTIKHSENSNLHIGELCFILGCLLELQYSKITIYSWTQIMKSNQLFHWLSTRPTHPSKIFHQSI